MVLRSNFISARQDFAVSISLGLNQEIQKLQLENHTKTSEGFDWESPEYLNKLDDLTGRILANFQLMNITVYNEEMQAIGLIVTMIRKAGLDRQKIQETLAKIDYEGVTGRIRFDSKGKQNQSCEFDGD